MKYFLFSIVLPILNSQARAGECVITEEYAEARKQAYFRAHEVHASYNDCRDSAQVALYWKALAACTEEGLGKEIGGGCTHLIGNGSYPMTIADKSHCEIFKISKEIENKYRAELMENISSKKCKT